MDSSRDLTAIPKVVDFGDHLEANGGVLEGIIAGIAGLTPQEVAKATRILPHGVFET
jgi:hypothetical protein